MLWPIEDWPRLGPGLQEQGHHGEDPVVGDGPHRPVPGKRSFPAPEKRGKNQHETHEKGEFQWDWTDLTNQNSDLIWFNWNSPTKMVI